MRTGETARRAHAVLATSVVLVGTATALTWSTRGALAGVRAEGAATFEELLVLSVAGAAWCIFGWLTAALLITLLAGLRRQTGRLDRVARAITPRAVRRMAALLLGLSLVGAPVALALPAHAGPPVAAGMQEPGATVTSSLQDLERWTPDRPVIRTGTGPDRLSLLVPRPHRERAALDHIVVRRGDTLWDIAARTLGPGASAADIATSWPRWHAANRSTIGPDPDLIRPGQQLRPPAG